MGIKDSEKLNISWDKISRYPVLDAVTPDKMGAISSIDFSSFEHIIGRSDVVEIEKSNWHLINDPKYKSLFLKRSLIKRYFACCAYIMATDPREFESVPKGGKKTYKKCTSISTTNKNSSTVSASVKTTLGYKSSASTDAALAKASTEFSASVEASVGIVDSKEVTKSETKSEETTVEFSATTEDVLVVPWMLVRGLVIYRELLKSGSVECLAYSEYPQLPVTYKSYEIKFDPKTIIGQKI
jgi:hypothetical protein